MRAGFCLVLAVRRRGEEGAAAVRDRYAGGDGLFREWRDLQYVLRGLAAWGVQVLLGGEAFDVRDEGLSMSRIRKPIH